MTEFIIWVQSASNCVLDTVFFAVTMLGSPLVLAVVAIVVYWCLDKYRGMSLALTLSTSVVLNTGLKELFRVPRPYTYHPDIDQIDRITGTGWSFPSGHAQLTASAATGLYLNFKKRIFAILAVAIPLSVSFSRIYLGVHTPLDVVCGMLIGALWAWVMYRLADWMLRHEPKMLLLLCIPQFVLLLFVRNHDLVRMAGLMLGFVIGFLLDERYLHFSPARPMRVKLLNLVLGASVAGVIKLICTLLLPHSSIFVVFEYALLGFSVSFVCPWVFCRINKRIKIG